ncbi:MAG: QacE family quaternary ammonium compound efflux SMR transporter [Ignavibacteriales bacterium]|nr:QacE family quaternary ammonium compound efflux SMR transporter [Ignavibacteriales bacterium]MCF8316721.1 QacE family quaternary ammonium compound efflux SMR transporter [Ignavibacteriales bacterium]MCF8436045.1 QacE family quaternary ammonium compound efflux SMR transporter [Ignavibacteriales bacterium]
MPWILLVIAGILEIGWVLSLKFSEGFTKLIPTITYAIFGFLSAFFFSSSLKNIPLGIAYSVWMGIAVVGTTFAEIYIESGSKLTISPYRLVFTLMIVLGVMGLKLSTIAGKN